MTKATKLKIEQNVMPKAGTLKAKRSKVKNRQIVMPKSRKVKILKKM